MEKSFSHRQTPQWVVRFFDRWHQYEVNFAVVAFSLIAVILVYDVFAREILAPIINLLELDNLNPLMYGSQKIAVYLLIAGSFCGIGIATWTGAQLVPQVLFKVVPASMDVFMYRLADTLTSLFFLFMTYLSYQFVADSWSSGQLVSGGVQIEVWKVQLALPLGFLSAMVRYIGFVIWPGIRPVADGEIE